MADVTLVPMSEARYEVWRDRAVAEYAAEHVKTGRWTAEEAPERSAEQFAELLPDGPATPDHWLWTVRSSAGDDVGVLWVARQPRPGLAFIFDIEMDESRRGQGFGTATLQALEEWCRANAFTSIGLHVFGHNTGAWQLYKRMGYVETNVNMEKQL
jgi:GNAT superfamily N-acetyltransferase